MAGNDQKSKGRPAEDNPPGAGPPRKKLHIVFDQKKAESKAPGKVPNEAPGEPSEAPDRPDKPDKPPGNVLNEASGKTIDVSDPLAETVETLPSARPAVTPAPAEAVRNVRSAVPYHHEPSELLAQAAAIELPTSFGSTKNKKVQGNVGGSAYKTKTTYRQYINRDTKTSVIDGDRPR